MKRPRKRASSVAVIDIGSNSVRLVVYEAMARSLITIFNEKALCGLGREVQSTGLLATDAVNKALTALRRFRALCKIQQVGRVYAIATAACRDAKNGPDFIAKAERICGAKIEILTGPREAKLSALGVVSGVHNPNGIVGDLGGGSLELIDVKGNRVRSGVTLPLGSLALQDLSNKSLKRAERIVKNELLGVAQLKTGRGRTFYAVGGTWRALARIHIIQSGYPLKVMHGYSIPAADALDFAQRLRRLAATNMLANIESVADARRPLLAYAALVLEYIIRVAQPKTIVFSTFGVREGLLYEMLPPAERAKDGLLCAAQNLNELLSRSARHAQELTAWTDRLVRVVRLRETEEDRRLRHVACLLSDIGWRVHPDHRGEETLSLIMNGNFGSITHQGRAFVALSVFYRYAGLSEENEPPPQIRALVTPAMDERARVLGAAFRVAHLITAARTGVLPATHFRTQGRKLMLVFEHRMVDLVADRVGSRFKQLARLVGRVGSIVRR
ncbi:exopolyphosphatase/guanosine-5'-triphosphate,3'-diphosphate pyrophosphatase [Bradyrhizobium japonicum]|uniref:exopolyphosphatase n=2 Tax=Bradyrhizobium elkanii TaxID=29448 RepID=A0A1E3EQ78_BRAEL|nr:MULTISPECIES: exopolyphosphatase [Bradyrhizobium]MTV13370.1 exopolyphosphatase [Bradyrhizobium sp. BR2003]MBP1298051.1 exopolyphosphatase/guanosine-5'-triphosphate,3'-diphosphate pyrophosphatase [Bradyrhizobium elkanii]MBP2427083.1 exopolyphosphatase/guanosine-5'-triphosphate,3'-diphosphate pyrophosphatase [Bradyrhizobium elkanii]MBR1161676.1 exopolyphosphatase [Bradyrhizobium elkanii]MCP1730681.1 exopolyphosphatase/guanosine-5'-triphosphate,3'-diphosphate pyrophosphatase [Bradyrhizobium el